MCNAMHCHCIPEISHSSLYFPNRRIISTIFTSWANQNSIISKLKWAWVLSAYENLWEFVIRILFCFCFEIQHWVVPVWLVLMLWKHFQTNISQVFLFWYWTSGVVCISKHKSKHWLSYWIYIYFELELKNSSVSKKCTIARQL